ncbi:unnamed protein product [Sphagnum troendelagicum]|uniref:Uncharacterized protein n=1 Tax=Sphagnum troendelagicum TaxID=128251 RepID=A0ABP0TZ49_9BRYO
MKKRKRRDAAAAEHETTCLQPSNSETKNGPLVGRENTKGSHGPSWSDGKILASEVTDRWCQCLPPGWIRGGNVAQNRAALTR